jgi:hypothetical protein
MTRHITHSDTARDTRSQRGIRKLKASSKPFRKAKTMSTSTVIGTLLALLILSWAVWFVIELVRYIINDGDAIDQRLRNIGR